MLTFLRKSSLVSIFRLACFKCLRVLHSAQFLLFRLNALLVSVCSKDSLICFADNWKWEWDLCRRTFSCHKFYNLSLFIFSLCTFFYPRHLLTPTTRDRLPTTFSYPPASQVVHQYLRMVCWCPSNGSFFLSAPFDWGYSGELVVWEDAHSSANFLNSWSVLNKCLVLLFCDSLWLITFSGITKLAWFSSSYWWHKSRCSGEAVLFQSTMNRSSPYPNYSVPTSCQGNSGMSC